MTTSIARGLIAWLREIAELDGLQVKLGRVDAATAPKSFVIVRRLGAKNYDTLGPQDNSLRDQTFSITAYAATDEKAEQMTEAIRAALENYVGPMGTDRRCRSAWFTGEDDEFADAEFDETLGRFASTLTATIQHSPQ